MKIQGVNASNNVPPLFSDVVESSYYNGAINWAYQYGIMNGTGNGQFNPSGNITKQDLAVTIYRYLLAFSVNQTNFIGHPGSDQYYYFGSEDYIIARENYRNKYHDAASISSYARDAVYELSCIGLITGSDADYFTPLSEIPLIEAACMFTRAHGYRYNNTDSINVYVRSYTGSEFNNVAVAYLRLGSATSYSTNDMQIKITSNGIANLLSDGNGSLDAHYVNAMSQYTSTFLPDVCSPSPFYQFITIPRNEADYELINSYNRASMYQHNSPYQCHEPTWSFPQWCPTQLMHSGQNFGWRYNQILEFHQGMDCGRYGEAIYNTTDFPMQVIGKGTDSESAYGKYIKVNLVGTSYYLVFQHLSEIFVDKNVIIPAGSSTMLGKTGNTGNVLAHLHLTLTTESGEFELFPQNAANRMNYYDPRILYK